MDWLYRDEQPNGPITVEAKKLNQEQAEDERGSRTGVHTGEYIHQ